MAYSLIPLSKITRDPEIAAFFERGEGDASAYAVSATPTPVLTGGEAVMA